MRQAVGVITGVFMALYFMYFFYPLLSVTHTNFNILVNATDPTIATSYTLGSGFYQAIPLLPLFIGAFVLINFALKRDAGEQEMYFGVLTNCIESSSCMPANPVDVLNLYDIWYGTGFSILAMAMIIGVITVAIYIRTRSLPMLAILGIYELTTFSSILAARYVASQYQIAIYVIGIGIATAVMMLILRLVKE